MTLNPKPPLYCFLNLDILNGYCHCIFITVITVRICRLHASPPNKGKVVNECDKTWYYVYGM